MQQALPSSIRQKKLNAKLMPPIKPSDTSSGSGQQTESAIQIQKDMAVSQSIRNKIKAKAKVIAELQAQKLMNEDQKSKKLPVLQRQALTDNRVEEAEFGKDALS